MGAPVVESKARILGASVTLFSEKGFDGTRVSEIADLAGVNKALIYYYFKSKEDILEGLISEFTGELVKMSMDIVSGLFGDGGVKTMSVTPDNVVSFGSQEEKDRYIRFSYGYYEKLVSFLVERRLILRVLVTESLKKGSAGNIMLRLCDLIGSESELQKISRSYGMDYSPDQRLLINKFFLGIVPVFNLAIYYDDWVEHYGTTGRELEKGFMDAFSCLFPAIVDRFSSKQ